MSNNNNDDDDDDDDDDDNNLSPAFSIMATGGSKNHFGRSPLSEEKEF